MRISVDRTDSGFRYDAASGKFTAYLNGKLVSKCVTADDDLGLVVRLRTDASGEVIFNEARDEVLRETLHGTVRIERTS